MSIKPELEAFARAAEIKFNECHEIARQAGITLTHSFNAVVLEAYEVSRELIGPDISNVARNGMNVAYQQDGVYYKCYIENGKFIEDGEIVNRWQIWPEYKNGYSQDPMTYVGPLFEIKTNKIARR